jgi:hypothetical protein
MSGYLPHSLSLTLVLLYKTLKNLFIRTQHTTFPPPAPPPPTPLIFIHCRFKMDNFQGNLSQNSFGHSQQRNHQPNHRVHQTYGAPPTLRAPWILTLQIVDTTKVVPPCTSLVLMVSTTVLLCRVEIPGTLVHPLDLRSSSRSRRDRRRMCSLLRRMSILTTALGMEYRCWKAVLRC